MKLSIFFSLSLLALTSAAQASTYTCKGLYEDNQGAELTLKLSSGSYSLHGTTKAGEGFGTSASCEGGLTNTTRNKKYDVYSANTDAACPVDYVKIAKDLAADGSGDLVLARTSGGDTHDASGYSYRYYHCSK